MYHLRKARQDVHIYTDTYEREVKQMRATTHNGRASRKGAYLAKHNDRRFDLDKAEHIDQDRTAKNIYWHCMMPEHPEMDFEQVEQAFYTHTFKDGLQAKNAMYKQHGNDKNIQTIEEYRRNPRSCPEEQIFMLGNKDFYIPVKTLEQICKEQLAWEEKEFPQVKVLDYAAHADEQGAPHVHIRRAWIGHDKAGNAVIGQNKALKEMGVERPDTNKPQTRYNNAKITYTRKCREHLIELCRGYGIDIELQPKERSETGLTQTEYKARQEDKKAMAAELRQQAAEQAAATIKKGISEDEFDRELANFWGDIETNDRLQELANIQAENDRLKEENARQQAEINRLEAERKRQHESLLKLTSAKSERAKELRRINYALEDKETELDTVKDDLSCIKKDLEEVTGYLTEAQQNRAWELFNRWDDERTH